MLVAREGDLFSSTRHSLHIATRDGATQGRDKGEAGGEGGRSKTVCLSASLSTPCAARVTGHAQA